MRFRTISKMLVAAVLAGGACGGRQVDTSNTIVTPPPAPARTEGWTRVSVLKLLDRHAPVPGDARGVYVRTPHCTNCIEVVRGPELYGACTDSPCAVPMATDPFADRLLYLTAGGHVQVVPWSALAPVVDRLVAERGAAASDDAEIAILRLLRDGGKLARTDAWVELTANGAFRIADGFPAELRVPPEQPVAEFVAAEPVSPGVALSLQQMMGHVMPADEASGPPPPEGPLAAIALALAALREHPGGASYVWVMFRPLARGALVTFGGGGGCSTAGTATFVVDDGAASLVDQMDLGFPDECRPRGRRPEGLASRVGDASDAHARWYAESMHMEAASVPAFERLAAELAALGAPARLVRASRAAARDEVRHAAIMARLGARVGARPTSVVVAPIPPRTLEQIAIENAVEGCVNEGFAALLCEYQAQTATNAALADAMTSIARDEQAHAHLAFAVAAWLDRQLCASQRAAVEAAVTAALAALPALAAREAERFASNAAPLGLPSPTAARALATHYIGWMTAAARRPRPSA
ncbi:MAG TPA: ferritin-like domain-containing protein [Kofleriaceae bacterium]|nr:ferritin-like domain-containing protein [Kofleriaceae bacterium]